MLKTKLIIIISVLLISFVSYNSMGATLSTNSTSIMSNRLLLNHDGVVYSISPKDWNYVYSFAILTNNHNDSAKIANLVTVNCKKYDLDVGHVTRLIFKESEYVGWKKSYEVDKNGVVIRDEDGKVIKIAYGLMQINFKYWSQRLWYFPELKDKLNTKKDAEKYICYWKYNIDIGCYILRYYLDRMDGNYALALTCYWAGPRSPEWRGLYYHGRSNHYTEFIMNAKKTEKYAYRFYGWKLKHISLR